MRLVNLEYKNILRQYRKKPLTSLQEQEKNPYFVKLEYSQDEIKKIIPHREPFLLIDRLLGIDLTKDNEIIIGSRFISSDDPVFLGHFPDNPIYPAALQMEMGGQLGLCLSYFVINNKTSIEENAKPILVRATKIHGALFLEPVLPDSELILISKKLDYDGFFGTVLSQIISSDKVTCVSINEVIFIHE